MFSITDDSGFLGLVEVNNYKSFVDEDWDLKQLFSHFREQIKEKNLLLWGTGCENIWKVQIDFKISAQSGYREFISSINVKNNKLFLINYESLTMAAQFSDVRLPERHMKDYCIEIENGLHKVRVIQFYNPEDYCYVGRSDIDFLIEIEKEDNSSRYNEDIPWCDI